MLIVTRYKAAKVTGITEAVFSRMWSRQQNNDDDYEFFTDDGKINIDHSAFISKYHDRIKPDVLEKIRNPKKKEVAKRKTVPKKRSDKKSNKKSGEKETQIIETKTPEVKTPKKESDEMIKLREDSNKAKLQKVIIDKEKSNMDLRKSRAELAEVDTLGKSLIGYCIALNQTLLDQPRSYIDEFEMAMKKGKSKTDLTDILRIPASAAIEDTIIVIKKELEKYRRAIRRAEKNRERKS